MIGNKCGKFSDRSWFFYHSCVVRLAGWVGLWSMSCTLFKLSAEEAPSSKVNTICFDAASQSCCLPKYAAPPRAPIFTTNFPSPTPCPAWAEVPWWQRLGFQTGLHANGWMRSQSQCSGRLTEQTCRTTCLSPSHYMIFKQLCPHKFELQYCGSYFKVMKSRRRPGQCSLLK